MCFLNAIFNAIFGTRSRKAAAMRVYRLHRTALRLWADKSVYIYLTILYLTIPYLTLLYLTMPIPIPLPLVEWKSFFIIPITIHYTMRVQSTKYKV